MQNIDICIQDSVTVHNPGGNSRSETMSQTKTVHGTVLHQSPARVQGASFNVAAKESSKEKRLTSDKGSSQGGNISASEHIQPNPEIKINHHDAPKETPSVHISIATTPGQRTPEADQPTLREVLFKELNEAKF